MQLRSYIKAIAALFFFLPFCAFAAFKTPLPAAQVFQLSTQQQAGTVAATWQIAPGYYLYKERLQFAVTPPAKLGNIEKPPGIPHQDTIFGRYEIYKQQVVVRIPLIGNTAGATLSITYQGCSDDGFCYPPTTTQVPLVSKPSHAIDSLLNSHNSLLITLGFFLLGILLAFTPCVFPMLPILSSIIVGHSKTLTTAKAFTLSLTYVLAMAFTYAAAGLVMGLAGSNLQSAMQHPAVIIGFVILLILLSLSLFGLYDLQLPASWQSRLAQLNQRQQGGTFWGVAIMGALSALIVSPCVSAPLIGALSYITQQANPWLGGSALLGLGLGMGLPLLIAATFGGSLLPKAGVWMETIKTVSGTVVLGLAISMLERIAPATTTIWLWAALFILTGLYLGAFEAAATAPARLWKSICALVLIYGVLLAMSAMQGNTYPWKLTAPVSSSLAINESPAAFRTLKTLAEVQQALATAQRQQQPVLLDFYADWCVACKKMERTTFKDPQVKAMLQKIELMRVDITANDEAARQVAQYFDVIAPPTFILFDQNGKELKERRLIGETEAKAFIENLNYR